MLCFAEFSYLTESETKARDLHLQIWIAFVTTFCFIPAIQITGGFKASSPVVSRLISERTVEENILKKANQKRLLGNVAIEGGNFTTAFFRENTLQELFAEPSGLDQLAKEKAAQEQAQAATRAEKEAAKAITQEQMEQVSHFTMGIAPAFF